MSLLSGVTVNGDLIKKTFEGLGSLAKDVKSIVTGKLSAEDEAKLMDVIGERLAKVDIAQTEVNKIEAAHPAVFVSGWRPFIGWVCGSALAFYYIPQCIAASVLWSVQCFMILDKAPDVMKVVFPVFPLNFNISEIIGLVGSMLGLTLARTYEKKINVARN